MEAVAGMIEVLPTALGSNETLLDTFRRVARAELSFAECDATFSLTPEGVCRIVASCVSRLVEACDQVMRHRLVETAPECEPTTWLDQQSLAIALATAGWISSNAGPSCRSSSAPHFPSGDRRCSRCCGGSRSDIDVLATSILGQEPGQLDEVALARVIVISEDGP